MSKLLVAERQQKIIELLAQNSRFKIPELAELLAVSKETLRRDLIQLESQRRLQRSHGGVIAQDGNSPLSFSAAKETNHSAKQKIAHKALSLVPESGVVYLDTGSSTVACLVNLLCQRKGLTIVTNSLNELDKLVNSEHAVIIVGGQLERRNMSMGGYLSANLLSSIKFELAVFGSNGFAGHKGPTTADFYDVQAKQTILQNSRINVVLADASKAVTTSLVQYAAWDEIDYLVTDDSIQDAHLTQLRQQTEVMLSEDEK